MFDFFAHTPAMLSLLKRLVEIESPSHNKTGVDNVGALVYEECRRLGGVVKLFPQPTYGNLIEASWGKGRDGILLLAHMDTVHPVGTIERIPFREVDDRVMGPGVEDMKGGIVIGLTALAAMVEMHPALTRPVTALFTSDEEIGSPTSRSLIEDLARQSALVLVLEPAMPDGALKTWRKGVGDFIVTVRGRAAHAGSDHQLGRNAIEELARQVLIIQNLTNYERGTTLNVGIIRGGTATNVVPEEAVAEVDLRIMESSEAARILASLHALKPAIDGTTMSVSGELNRPPMPANEMMKTTFERIREIAAGIGMELIASGTGGASDANFVAPLGIPVLDGLGAVVDGGHSEREFILKHSLPERAKLLATILQRW
jgi:glutamate carboxypeptidase